MVLGWLSKALCCTALATTCLMAGLLPKLYPFPDWSHKDYTKEVSLKPGFTLLCYFVFENVFLQKMYITHEGSNDENYETL